MFAFVHATFIPNSLFPKKKTGQHNSIKGKNCNGRFKVRFKPVSLTILHHKHDCNTSDTLLQFQTSAGLKGRWEF